jgi:hypothetical protein
MEVAVNVTGVNWHTVSPGAAVAPTTGITNGITVTVIELTAVSGDTQAAELVSLQVTMSPATGTYEYVGPEPTLIPFTLHWYNGVVPPFTGIGVKVVLAPRQAVSPTPVVMLTAGDTNATRVITAAPLMGRMQPVIASAARTVYVPATLNAPNDSEKPVPDIVVTKVVSRNNW